MKSHQFTIAFTKAITINELVKLLKNHYGGAIEIGHGLHNNGIPQEWIVVNNERPKRVD